MASANRPIDHSNKLEYESKLMRLYCDEAYRYVLVQLIIVTTPLERKTTVEKVLEVLKEKKMSYLISDVSQLVLTEYEIEEWLSYFLVDQWKEFSLRKHAIVGCYDEQMQHAVNKQFFSAGAWITKIRYCSTFEEAEEWVLRVD